MSVNTINTYRLNDNIEYSIPKVTIKINKRRRSADDEKLQTDYFAIFRYLKSQKPRKIPKIEAAFDDANCYSPKLGQNYKEFRPSTSPLSMILRNLHKNDIGKKTQKSKLKELPIFQKNNFINTEEMQIAGRSVKHYDWVSTFLDAKHIQRFNGNKYSNRIKSNSPKFKKSVNFSKKLNSKIENY